MTFSKLYFPRLPEGGGGIAPWAADLSEPQKYYKWKKKTGERSQRVIRGGGGIIISFSIPNFNCYFYCIFVISVVSASKAGYRRPSFL